MDIEKETIKIINDGTFLIATMPNGEIIPMQMDLLLSNGLNERGLIEVKVMLRTFVNAKDFEIIKPHIK